MKRKVTGHFCGQAYRSILAAAVSFLILFGSGAPAKAAWSSGSTWSSNSSTSGSSWSSGGSTSSGSTPTCIAANLTLSLAKADCLKCHPGDNVAQATMHHKLFNPPPCLSCHSFTGTTLDPLQSDCISCHLPPQPPGSTLKAHGPSVHDTVSHCVVYDSCGKCHKGSLPSIHANANTSGSSYSYHGGSYGNNSVNPGTSSCYLCHTSTNPTVQQTVIKGLAGQKVACSNCHNH